MDYRELVQEISFSAKVPNSTVRRVLDRFLYQVQVHIIAGDPVVLKAIGRLQRGVTAPRGGLHNSKHRSANVIYFRAARSLRNKMRQT